ncbi:MAG: hypothetical protein ACK5KM_05180, partial [Hyphomicrobiaceae bacterium]
MENKSGAFLKVVQWRSAALSLHLRLAGAVLLMLLMTLAANVPTMATPADEASFGERLAAAARNQTWVPTIYDPAYRKIEYPGG